MLFQPSWRVVLVSFDGFELPKKTPPMRCLDSLEPVCRDVEVAGAWSCVTEGGGLCCDVAEVFFAI